MTGRSHDDSSKNLRRMYARHRESDTTLGIAIALIAMLFIAGIVTAFIHASDLSQERQAQRQAQASQHRAAAAETTGSGSTKK